MYEVCMNAIADAAIDYLTCYVDICEEFDYQLLHWWVNVWEHTAWYVGYPLYPEWIA